ncbi:MAG: cytochrome c-type biogenesis protein [Pseudomonadota bacterium]
MISRSLIWSYIIAIATSILIASQAVALTPEEVLDDPALEERAREISLNVRCLVCQNQSIDDSDAELAKDLRTLIRERLVAGDSKEDVLQFLVSRYGEFVLLTPPFSMRNAALWALPGLVFLLGVGAAFAYTRAAKSRKPATVLSSDEEAKLADLLAGRERTDS